MLIAHRDVLHQKKYTLQVNITSDVEKMPLHLSIMLHLLLHRQSVELKFQSFVLRDMVPLGIACN